MKKVELWRARETYRLSRTSLGVLNPQSLSFFLPHSAWEPYHPVYYFYREMDPQHYTTNFKTLGTQSVFKLGECLLILFIMGEKCKEKLLSTI